MEISISTVFSGNSIKNGQPISGQDKPVISVGFKAQTIHTQPTIQQIVKPISV